MDKILNLSSTDDHAQVQFVATVLFLIIIIVIVATQHRQQTVKLVNVGRQLEYVDGLFPAYSGHHPAFISHTLYG